MPDKKEINNRKASFLLIAAFCLSVICFTAARSEKITINYIFERPVIESIQIENNIYDRIIMPGVPNCGNPGQPSLPSKGARILIPYSSEIESVIISPGERINLGSQLLIEPVGIPIMMSAQSDYNPEVILDDDIYSSSDQYPPSQFEQIGTHLFRGYKILILKLNPVVYLPAAGELSYCNSLQVVVETRLARNASPMLRGLRKDEDEMIGRIDNPEILASYASAPSRSSGEGELIIFTVPWLVEKFQPLKDYHDSTGTPTAIYTIFDAYNETGGISPLDVREFIRIKYLNDGVRYVLLGDDNDQFPSNFFGVAMPSTILDTTSYIYDMPADNILYGCLDGPLDFDGDGVYGETTDGEGGGDIDLIAEVYVGRAAIDDSTDIRRFVDKTIQYLESNDPSLANVLLTGEKTYYPGPMRDGSMFLVELVDSATSNGYSTAGIPSNLYDIEAWDELGIYPWDTAMIINAIRQSLHVINHAGHSSFECSNKLCPGNLDTLNNENPFFIYSHGCFAGMFDVYEQCWAEHATVKTEGGAFAAIMNARMGWGTAHTTDGLSQRYNRQFWDAVFNPEENKPQLGRANQDSKEDNLFRINESGMRYCYYELNLFGDPSVAIKRPRALAFQYPNGIPSVVTSGQSSLFQVAVSSLYAGEPIPGSGLLHYAYDDDESQTMTMTEIEPDLYEVMLPAVECGNELSFYVSVEEATTGRITDVNPVNAHRLIPVIRDYIAFEDDFETDKGWDVSGGLWERGLPSGGGGEYGPPDPTDGCNGTSVLGYNLSGDYENGMVAMHVTSPAINCTFLSNVHLTFDRWLGLQKPTSDSASISVSVNGTEWTRIWANNALYVDTCWIEMNFDISDIAARQSSVYLRWTMGPTNDTIRYCGWNIDDVVVSSYDCLGYFCGDANGDEYLNVGDAVYLINYIFKSGPAPDPLETGDVNCDDAVNVGDAVHMINYIFKSGPPPAEYCYP